MCVCYLRAMPKNSKALAKPVLFVFLCFSIEKSVAKKKKKKQ